VKALYKTFEAVNDNERLAEKIAILIKQAHQLLHDALPKGGTKKLRDEVALAYTPFKEITKKYDAYCSALVTPIKDRY